MGKRIIWVALCATIGLAAAAVAHSGVPAGQNTNSGAQGNTNAGQSGNTNGNMSGGGGTGGAQLASADRRFVMNAAMSDLFEIEAGRLALERASSDAVRQAAQRLIDDHTRTSQELTQLAASKGVTPPTALDSKHRSMLERLRRQNGAEFDREFARTAGVRAHQDAVKLFRQEASRGRDADLRAFAARTLPALEEHLRMAQSAHAAHGGGNSGNSGGNTNRNANGNTGGGNSNRGGNTNNGNR